jgi:hypothetical protein
MTSSWVRTNRTFVSGQLVELWEDPEVAFGCARADLQRYADREEWVLLFNAMMLNTPRAELECGS